VEPVALAGATAVECALWDDRQGESEWIVRCDFLSVGREEGSHELEDGDSQLVWIEIRKHGGALLVHVEEEVTYRGEADGIACASVRGSVQW
jgi:hypothetical protein